MNSNQFLSLLKKGNDLQKEDFQQLVKLHGSFPYFQIPAVLAAKYELRNSKQESSELLHIAAILSPNRSRLKYLVEERIGFFDAGAENDVIVKIPEPVTSEDSGNISTEVLSAPKEEGNSQNVNTDESPSEYKKTEEALHNQEYHTETETEKEPIDGNSENVQNEHQESEKTLNSSGDLADSEDLDIDLKASASSDVHEDSDIEEKQKEDKKPDAINFSLSEDGEDAKPDLITTPYGGDEATRPGLILSASEEIPPETETTKDGDVTGSVEISEKEEEKPIIASTPVPPSSRQQILKQLEDNLARLKSESVKNKPEEKPAEEAKPTITRRKRTGEDLIDSIKKKEKREIKDTKKKEQNDIIKAFNKKSIKMAAIKENEDANKLQDLSLPSTKINDRMVSESYAKLLTQQGKKAAAKEIYKKLILKFPQKKAYFADLIQQLEE